MQGSDRAVWNLHPSNMDLRNELCIMPHAGIVQVLHFQIVQSWEWLSAFNHKSACFMVGG